VGREGLARGRGSAAVCGGARVTLDRVFNRALIEP
jgi:hypothetical protein